MIYKFLAAIVLTSLFVVSNAQAMKFNICTGAVAKMNGAVSASYLDQKIQEAKENLSKDQKRTNANIRRLGLRLVSLDKEVVKYHEKPFQKVITALGKVPDQQQSGDCWEYATSQALRDDAERQGAVGKKFQLSKNFLYFYSVVEKANMYFEDVISLNPDRTDSAIFAKELNLTDAELEFRIADGGEYAWMMFLISKYGLVPQEKMPDTHTSLNTSELFPILRSVVFETSSKMTKKLVSFGNPAILTPEQYAEVEQIKSEGQDEVLKILTATLGFPPSATGKFKFNLNDARPRAKPIYKYFNPKTFAKDVIQFDPDAFVTFSNTPLHPKNESYIIQKHGSIGVPIPGQPTYTQRFVNVNSHQMLQLIKKQIDANKAVSIAIDVSKNADTKSGMIDQSGFKAAKVLGLKPIKINRRDLVNVGLLGPDHAVAIVGYDADENGNIVRLLIMNSWGPKAGQKGFFSMDVDTAKMQLFEADIGRKFISRHEENLSKKPNPVPVESQKTYYGPAS